MKKILITSFFIAITALLLTSKTFAKEDRDNDLESTAKKQMQVEQVQKYQENKREAGKKRLENKREAGKKRLENKREYLEKLRTQKEERIKEIKEKREKRLEEIKKLKDEKKEKLAEKIEEKKQQRELESRGVKAKLEKAEFNINSKTGEITVTDANGKVHNLNHLPDQAIERIRAKIKDKISTTDVKIETTSNGDVQYKVGGVRKTKLFGLISRNINTEITLDDTTGTVTENPVTAKSFLGRLLNKLSF